MKKTFIAILMAAVLVLSLGLVIAVPTAANPDSVIVGLWHLDGNASDCSGNGNNGTAYGTPNWFMDRWGGQALACDGDDYVSVSDDPSLNIGTGDFAIEAWIKTTQTIEGAIIYKMQGSDPYPGYGLKMMADGKLEVHVQSHNVSNSFRVKTTSSFNDGAWYHVFVTVDRSEAYADDAIKICVNGVMQIVDVVKEIGDITASIDTTNNLHIGTYHSPGNYFNGLIDEVRIWDSVHPELNLTVNPQVAVNLVTDPPSDHALTATVNITRTDDVLEPAHGVMVIFKFVSGPNVPEPPAENPVVRHTDSNGEAQITYTDDGGAGVDQINVSIDEDCSGPPPDEDEGDLVRVRKSWVEHYVTGGGKLNVANGKKVGYSFAGMVGVLPEGGVAGQFQIVDHTGKKAETWHFNEFDWLTFIGDDAVSPYATHDKVRFISAPAESNRGNTIQIMVTIADIGPEKDKDQIAVYRYDGEGPPAIYEWEEWFGGEVVLPPTNPADPFAITNGVLDGGNFQIHQVQ